MVNHLKFFKLLRLTFCVYFLRHALEIISHGGLALTSIYQYDFRFLLPRVAPSAAKSWLLVRLDFRR